MKIVPMADLIHKASQHKKARFGFSVVAEGMKKGHKLRKSFSISFPSQGDIDRLKIGANYISYPTAFAAKLFIMALPELEHKGVYPPEKLPAYIAREILKKSKKLI